MPKYNGYKNWNHWNVSLWINNDEGLYRLAKECIANADNRNEAVRDMLALLKSDHLIAGKTPDGAPYSVSSIRAAMVDM